MYNRGYTILFLSQLATPWLELTWARHGVQPENSPKPKAQLIRATGAGKHGRGASSCNEIFAQSISFRVACCLNCCTLLLSVYACLQSVMDIFPFTFGRCVSYVDEVWFVLEGLLQTYFLLRHGQF